MSIGMFAHSHTQRIAGLTAAVALALGVVVTAPADARTTRSTTGLFGSADPTFDGAYRQSMALLGLSAANAPVPTAAVTWLTGQQCASGAFQSYRADTAVPCSAPNPATFSGPDSNSTALAAMALQAVGKAGQATRAANALIAAQNADGGWGYTIGGASDVNSTGLSIAAIKGASPSDFHAARTAVNKATGYLKAVQIPCAAAADARFGLPFQPGQKADALASAQGLIGIAGTLPATRVRAAAVRNATCKDTLERQVASFVDQLVRSTGGPLPSAFDSTKTDWNSTANAVIALAAAGGAQPAVALGVKALGANVVAYTGIGPTASPAALGTLIQAAVVSGTSPRRFGTPSTNLVVSLLATVQK